MVLSGNNFREVFWGVSIPLHNPVLILIIGIPINSQVKKHSRLYALKSLNYHALKQNLSQNEFIHTL
jgi:hypothetical protein